MNILDEIVSRRKERLAEKKKNLPAEALIRQDETIRPFYRGNEAVTVTAECKKGSPSRGIFLQDYDPVQIASEYEKGGAHALSVLTEPELLAADDRDEYPGLIRIGIDGLLLRYKSRSGLLLPVVATEYGMDGKRFLEALCHKAGLPPDTWRENDCDIFTFQAIVISE